MTSGSYHNGEIEGRAGREHGEVMMPLSIGRVVQRLRSAMMVCGIRRALVASSMASCDQDLQRASLWKTRGEIAGESNATSCAALDDLTAVVARGDIWENAKADVEVGSIYIVHAICSISVMARVRVRCA